MFTSEQKEIARHMLGLPNKQRRSYRNRFCADEGHDDYPKLKAMYDAGYLRRRAAGDTWVADMWWLTREGAQLALNKDERLCPEDFPQKQK